MPFGVLENKRFSASMTSDCFQTFASPPRVHSQEHSGLASSNVPHLGARAGCSRPWCPLREPEGGAAWCRQTGFGAPGAPLEGGLCPSSARLMWEEALSSLSLSVPVCKVGLDAPSIKIQRDAKYRALSSTASAWYPSSARGLKCGARCCPAHHSVQASSADPVTMSPQVPGPASTLATLIAWAHKGLESVSNLSSPQLRTPFSLLPHLELRCRVSFSLASQSDSVCIFKPLIKFQVGNKKPASRVEERAPWCSGCPGL